MSLPLEGRKIGLLTASASRQGGGVFEAVVSQARLIAGLGGEVEVFALHDSDSDADRARFDGIPVRTFAVSGPRQFGFAPRLVEGLISARLDCLHLHGIWMYPSQAGSRWAAQTGRPCIISPHGMLDPWITARGRWKKALARLGYERRSWRRAWAMHALTSSEAADIARESGRWDSLVIPNAGPQAQALPATMPAPVIAYLGRIHPKKNLDSLVAGWNLASRPEGARLRIAGWGDDADVARFTASLAGADPSIEFLGPVFGEAKERLIAGARFMALPSHSEGLPMAMLEAWAAARPTLMTGQCNLPEGFAAGAALDCGYDSATVARAMEHAFSLDAGQWHSMAQAAHRLAAGPFSAQTVAGLWAKAYARAIAGGSPE
ncbi:MAG: glycosyltransferase [Novosphingobium sp.]